MSHGHPRRGPRGSVVSLVILAMVGWACATSDNVDPGPAGSGGNGNGGTTGAAGDSGSAGTTGAAGDGSMAGNNGTGGTTGVAGASGGSTAGTLGGGAVWKPRMRSMIHTPRKTGEVVVPFAVTFRTLA